MCFGMDAGASLHAFVYISPVPTSKSIHLIIHLVIIGRALSPRLLRAGRCSSSGNKAANKAQSSPPCRAWSVRMGGCVRPLP